MSARMGVELRDWKQIDEALPDLGIIEMESLLQNMDQKNIVAPLRQAHEALTRPPHSNRDAGEQRQAALKLQEQWNSWLSRREILRDEIKRGKDCLEQVRHDLAATRARMEEWPAYERQCGKSPLL